MDFFLTWFGRYKKTPRVKFRKYKFGSMPIGSANNGVDLLQKKHERFMV
jgi:hypothetical protein